MDSFDELGLKPELLRGIYSYGFEKPSAIQQRAIPVLTTNKDVFAQAQSGTGKTATFTISMLQNIDHTVPATQSLILAPTRELASQIYDVVCALGSGMEGLAVDLQIGGQNTITRGLPHVVVGTPGRVYDNICRGKLTTSSLKMVILDEADEILSRGFQEQMHQIFKEVPTTSQVALFTATNSRELDDLLTHTGILRDPVMILVKNDELTLEGIKQFYIELGRDDSAKYATLCDLYKMISVTQSIVYCNSRRRVEQLSRAMRAENYTVTEMTSDLSQPERERVMREFREGRVRVLISTDILARGIDVQQVSLVINFDMPTQKETYIHRIGRSGRFGRKGVAINFVVSQDDLKGIMEFYGTAITPLPANVGELLSIQDV